MCAIAGVFGKEDEATVRAMVACQAHRGPDDQHVVVLPGATLGAARLAIMGPFEGRQPVVGVEGRVAVAFNGELYRDTSGCDTLALPELYERYREKFVESIDGMFAIAVWDVQRRQGMLVRDRVGKKPLHYWVDREGALWFASEVKALFVVPGFRRESNPQAIESYIQLRYVPDCLPAWRGVAMLGAGTWLSYNTENQAQTLQRYWHLSLDNEIKDSEEVLAEQLLEHLRAAVRRRLQADAPLGFFLSGGLDSSLVLALAAEAGYAPLRTFNLGYCNGATPGKEADFLAAHAVANFFGAKHKTIYLTPEIFRETLPEIVATFDVPFSGVLSSWFLSEGVREAGIKVVLCGDGADELFGSYATHRAAATGGGEVLNRVLLDEFQNVFVGSVLTYADRLSMAHGLEVRSPFLDRSVVEYAMRIPGKYKIRDGVCKSILKKAARGLLPDWVIDREKEGFLSPRDVWLKDELRGLVDEVLTPTRVRAAGLEPKIVSALVEQLPMGGWQAGREVWKFLMLVLWIEAHA